jgi:hypothetical protein
MKWTKAPVSRLAKQAAKALARGQCLRAGALIDNGYFNLGRSRTSVGRKALRAVDERFERRCVRRHPHG